MKTTKLWLTTIAALLYSITASASSIEIEGIWYNLISKAQQAEVTRNPNIAEYEASYSASSINIPATVTYDGIVYNVTSIERWKSRSRLPPEGTVLLTPCNLF